MSNILIKAEEKIINAALSGVSLSGTEHCEGPKIPIPFGPDKPLWSVTLNWRVDSFSASIVDGEIKCGARVHGDATNFSYTDDIEGSMIVQMSGNTLVVTMRSLKVTLYIKPLGHRIDILDFDIVDRLPPEAKNIRIEVLKDALRVPLPDGDAIALGVQNPQITLTPGVITLSANMDVSLG